MQVFFCFVFGELGNMMIAINAERVPLASCFARACQEEEDVSISTGMILGLDLERVVSDCLK